MKYWLLTSEYPPFYGGGISTYSRFTALMMAEQGHQVSVFVYDYAVKDIKIEQQEEFRIIRFNPSRTGSSSFLGYITSLSYEYAHIVKHFIEKEGKPDIIESQEYLGIAYYLLQFKLLLYDWMRDVPVIITMHSPSFLYMEYNQVSMYRHPNYWVCEMEKYCLQAANHVISPSHYMVQELGKRFTLAHTRLSVIPNPYHSEQDMDNNNKTRPDQIVFYGKLTAQKGVFQLLRYFDELWQSGFSRPLYLIGAQDIIYHPENRSMGDLVKSRYKKYIQSGLLKMEDKIPPSGMTVRLSGAEVVIVPSNNDNLPYVVMEMMSLGKIVLGSRQGGQVEAIKEGVDGFVFDHEYPATFSQQLQKILQLSDEEKKMIGRNAKMKIGSRYSFEKIYPVKIKAVEEVIREKETVFPAFPFIRTKTTDGLMTISGSGEKGKLSVVIPFYNMGSMLADAVYSIQKSLYPEKEILIVNDGSMGKENLDALNQFRDIPGIRILDTPNRGLAAARNYGAENANGEYLAFLDADDKVEPDYYSKAIRVLQHYSHVHFVGCWTQYFENSLKVWPSFTPEPPLILYQNLVNSSALVFKRHAFLKAGLNDVQMPFKGWEDYDSVINMMASGLPGVVLPEILFHYRVRQNSMVRSLTREKKLYLRQYLTAKHEKFYATFAAGVLNLTNENGPPDSTDNPSMDFHLTAKLPFGNGLSVKAVSLIKRNRHFKSIAYKVYRYLKK